MCKRPFRHLLVSGFCRRTCACTRTHKSPGCRRLDHRSGYRRPDDRTELNRASACRLGSEMLGFFPRCLPDETLYSVVARYRAIYGGSSSATLKNVFDDRRHTFSLYFPKPLASLASKLPPQLGFGVDYIIDHHTMLPYYSRFVQQKSFFNCKKNMISGGKDTTPFGDFFRGNVKNPQYLKFCTICAIQHQQDVGYAAWLRYHQLPGVLVCSVHNKFLTISSSATSGTSQLKLPSETAAKTTSSFGLNLELALRIARSTRWLLDNPAPPLLSGELACRMRQVLLQKDFTFGSGSTQQTRLGNRLRADFSREFLASVGLGNSDSHCPGWITETYLRRNHINCAPLPSLLLLASLDVEVAHFFKMPLSTVNKSAQCGPQTSRHRSDFDERLAKSKSVILGFLAINRQATRQELCIKIADAVKFARRYDNTWLKGTLPPLAPSNVDRGRRIDWGTRDETLVQVTRLAVISIRGGVGRPRRVTIAAIMEHVGYKPLGRHRAKLPKTNAVITDAFESNLELTIRRLAWAARHFEAVNVLPNKRRLAGLAACPCKLTPTIRLEINRLHEQLIAKLSISSP